MRHPATRVAAIAAAGLLAGCGTLFPDRAEQDAVERGMQGVNVIDESNLNDVMLTVGDPDEAVSYFRRALSNDPDRVDLARGLAMSLVRARRIPESLSAWKTVTDHPDARDEDRVGHADALIRAGEWERAETMLDSIPPTLETYRRYRLEAMVADSNEEWDRADSFYEIATGLTETPSAVLNNWGYSKLSRGDHDGAERLFVEAIRLDRDLFTAKNNLVMARGAQGTYTLPVVPMTQEERARLLHTAGLAAVKRGDVTIGQGLFREALETHPRHFEAAARALAALEAGG